MRPQDKSIPSPASHNLSSGPSTTQPTSASSHAAYALCEESNAPSTSNTVPAAGRVPALPSERGAATSTAEAIDGGATDAAPRRGPGRIYQLRSHGQMDGSGPLLIVCPDEEEGTQVLEGNGRVVFDLSSLGRRWPVRQVGIAFISLSSRCLPRCAWGLRRRGGAHGLLSLRHAAGYYRRPWKWSRRC